MSESMSAAERLRESSSRSMLSGALESRCIAWSSVGCARVPERSQTTARGVACSSAKVRSSLSNVSGAAGGATDPFATATVVPSSRERRRYVSCEVSWERVRVPYGVVVELHALGDVLARAARQLLRVHQSETARRSKFVLVSARSTVGSDARAHTERERASPGPRAPRRAPALARPSPHRHYPQARRALQGQCRSLCHHQTRPTATVRHSFHAFHRHRPAPRVSPVHADTTAQSSCRAGLIPADTLERPVEFSLASPARARALQGRVHSLTSLARVTDYQGVQESTRARRVQGAARLVGRQARHYRAPS